MPGVVQIPATAVQNHEREQPSPERAAQLLDSPQSEERFRACRFLKNLAIGNKTRKGQLLKLGVGEKLVRILGDPDPLIVIQAASAIGSLAYGNEEGVRSLFAAGASKALLELTRGGDAARPADVSTKVVEAAARALKTLFNGPNAPPAEGEVVRGMLPLLSCGWDSVSEAAASVIARCCEAREHREWILAQHGVALFLPLLSAKSPKSQEAALDCLAALSRGSPEIGRSLAHSAGPILRLVRDKRPRIRLLAATCVVHMSAGAAERGALDARLAVLPAVVKLFAPEQELEVRVGATRLLAALVADSEELQKAATDADAIGKLGAFVTAAACPPRLREGALTALAALCSTVEESRKACIDGKILPAVVAALEDGEQGVRAAACRLARSLSRSVKNLRTSLVDAGIALPLFKLLSDRSVEVQISAAATVCNIVLDFSPMKKVVLENGGVARLVALTQSPDATLRLNAVWALKNLCYMAEGEVKGVIVGELTYARLFALVEDPSAAVQEQALTLLRNLAYGKRPDIEAVFAGAGSQLMPAIQRCLASERAETLTQALYVVTNIACGDEAHKEAIMQCPDVLRAILAHMGHARSSIRVAAIWCVINLTWRDDPGTPARGAKLRAMGFLERLAAMAADPDLDVRDRVRTALSQLEAP